MAIAFMRASCISRQKGQSVVASAAYRACEKLKDERHDKEHDYSVKRGWIDGDLLLPEGIKLSREELWNRVEKSEKRIDARLAKEFVVALPKELSNEENIKLAKEIAKILSEEKKEDGKVDKYPVQWDIHAPHVSALIDDNGDFVFDENGKKVLENNSNIHCHFLVTERAMEASGEFATKKDRNRNSKEWLASKKLEVEKLINARLKNHNIKEVDFRSWEERNKESLEKNGKALEKPQEHLGVKKNNIYRKRRRRKARIRQKIERFEKEISRIDNKQSSETNNNRKQSVNVQSNLNWNKEIEKRVEININKEKNINSINSLPKIKQKTNVSSATNAPSNERKTRCAMCGILVTAECKKCHFFYEDKEKSNEGYSR